VGVEVFIYSRC